MTRLAAKHEAFDAAAWCGVETAMRDGTLLVCDVWGADPGDPKPAVLERTPYGRSTTDQAERCSDQFAPSPRSAVAHAYIEAGFAYCIQDCRGTGDSAGSFDKYVQEGDDSTDTIAWIRQQPWCNGKVVMVGFSYGAACQLAALVTQGDTPDAVILDCGGFSDALTSGIRQGGALTLKQATWSHTQARRDASAKRDTERAGNLARHDLLAWLRRGPWIDGNTPLAGFPEHQANLLAMWRNALDGPYWDRPGLRSPAATLYRSGARALLVTSWFDTSLRATLENFAALSAPGAACPKPELIIGPWSHGDRWSSVVGEVDVGADALPENGLIEDFPTIRKRFLQKALMGDETPVIASPDQGRVHYFELSSGEPASSSVSGAALALGGKWRHVDCWPPVEALPHDLHLTDSALTARLGEPSIRRFRSDPDDPVPTLGGAINSGGAVMPGGMFDQSPLDVCSDIARFETPLFERTVAFAGPVGVEIWASSDAPDFDITAKLLLVLEDGTAVNVSDGICRARHRLGLTTEDFVPADTPVCIPVELNPIALRVAQGERLRLDIAGSNFPSFDINPQTGAPQGYPSERRTTEIAIHGGLEHPSKLQLMVLPT